MIKVENLLPTLKSRMQYRITAEYDDRFFTNRIKHCISKSCKKRDGLIQKIWKIFMQTI